MIPYSINTRNLFKFAFFIIILRKSQSFWRKKEQSSITKSTEYHVVQRTFIQYCYGVTMNDALIRSTHRHSIHNCSRIDAKWRSLEIFPTNLHSLITKNKIELNRSILFQSRLCSCTLTSFPFSCIEHVLIRWSEMKINGKMLKERWAISAFYVWNEIVKKKHK